MTVEPASATPEILGELSFAGETGVEPSEAGSAGAVESSTYVTPAEQPETLPAASVAVALKVVVESSDTATVRPGLEKAAAVPLAATEPEQSLVVYSLTVEPPSAVPLIFGELSLAAETGADASEEGATGALESSRYATPAEQVPVLPAASVAVALKVVDESSETATVRPGLEKAAAVPLAATDPEQSLVV